MTTQIIDVSAPEPRMRAVEEHRATILKEACRILGIDAESLKEADKMRPPWNRHAGIIAYLLDRDTNASVSEIARLMGSTRRDTSLLIEFIARQIRQGVPQTRDELLNIGDAVLDTLNEEGIVWHRKLSSKKQNASLPKVDVTALIAKLEGPLGVTAKEVCSGRRRIPLVNARYAIIGICVHQNPSATLSQLAISFGMSTMTITNACKALCKVLKHDDVDSRRRYLDIALDVCEITDIVAFLASIKRFA